MKVLGDAPAMAMGNLFWTIARLSGDSGFISLSEDLLGPVVDIPKQGSPDAFGGAEMFAAAPVEAFDWGAGGSEDGGGRDGSHHRASHGGDGDAGMTAALSLFKAFGHGDLDI